MVVRSIRFFNGQYRFLSNFYPSPMLFKGKSWPTVEHLYQAFKTRNKNAKEEIRLAETPSIAKRLGQKVVMKDNWEAIKLKKMALCLDLKFRDPNLREMLLDTGDAHLEEGNTWRDYYWGVCNGKGENHLGILLMELRENLTDG